MKKRVSILSLALLVSLLTACGLTGDEVARLPINGISTSDDNLIEKEATIELEKDEKIAIWSEMNMKYEGSFATNFKIEILKNGEPFDRLVIDPTEKNITIGESKISKNGKTTWRFSGKNAVVKIEEDGRYTFKAMLVTSNPTLQIKKAELVLKK